MINCNSIKCGECCIHPQGHSGKHTSVDADGEVSLRW